MSRPKGHPWWHLVLPLLFGVNVAVVLLGSREPAAPGDPPDEVVRPGPPPNLPEEERGPGPGDADKANKPEKHRWSAKAGKKDPEDSPLPLEGDLLVLVLATETSSLKPGREEHGAFLDQLEQLQAAYGPRLLGKRLYVLDRGALRAWDRQLQVEAGKAFANDGAGELFSAAFAAVEKKRGQARNKRFTTVLIWETDDDPDESESRKVSPPAGSDIRLCVRCIGDMTLEKPERWFPKKVVQPRGVGEIGNQIGQLLGQR